MRKALLIGGAGLLVAAAGLHAAAAPKLTARTVTNGFVRSNVLLPIGGRKTITNPVPQDLSDLSGWTHEELEVGLEKQYDVDVVAVTNFLYSDQGETFLKESLNSNYHPYYSQTNDLQAVRSAIILDAEDGQLSSYGMMAKLPTDQRLQGSMKVCNAHHQGDFHKDTSLLSWYMNTRIQGRGGRPTMGPVVPLREAPPQGSPPSQHEPHGTPPARRSSDAVCRENQHGSNPSPEPPFRHPSPPGWSSPDGTQSNDSRGDCSHQAQQVLRLRDASKPDWRF